MWPCKHHGFTGIFNPKYQPSKSSIYSDNSSFGDVYDFVPTFPTNMRIILEKSLPASILEGEDMKKENKTGTKGRGEKTATNYTKHKENGT
jgi:hypothetical protein